MRGAVSLVVLFFLMLGPDLLAQSLTTGAIEGRVTEIDSGEALPGVMVTLGTQIAITDSEGRYKISDIVPGTYDIGFDFDTASASRTGVVVSGNAVTRL